MLAGKVYLLRRNIDSHDARGYVVLASYFSEYSAAAAYIDRGDRPESSTSSGILAPTGGSNGPSIGRSRHPRSIDLLSLIQKDAQARGPSTSLRQVRAAHFQRRVAEISLRLFGDAVLFVLRAQDAIDRVGSAAAGLVVVADLHFA